MSNVHVGSVTSITVEVTADQLASRLEIDPGEVFPSVFSTPWLLAQMERAAAKALHPLLKDGQVSVGAKVTLEHSAPTPVGAQVVVNARYLGLEGMLHSFEIWAEDSGGIIGKASHDRAIVPRAAVEQRAAKRLSTASK